MAAARKVVLVTGSTDGIGRETARALAALGHRVVVHGRSPEKARGAAEAIAAAVPGADLATAAADLSSLAGVRALAEGLRRDHPRLDVLLHNAGIYATGRRLTPDGLEATFAVNHLAPFLLTHLLLDRVREARGRVVTVSSIAHQRGRIDLDDLQLERGFDGYRAYAASKLMNVLFTFALAERLSGSGATATCLHPGVVGTKLLREGFGMDEGPDDLAAGAATSVFLAVSPEAEGLTGRYFARCRPAPHAPAADDRALREGLWEASARLAGLPA